MAYDGEFPFTEPMGGTNQSTYAQGDILYASAADTLSKLTVGTSDQVLTSNGTIPVWASSSSTGQGWVFLASAVASDSATLDFTSFIDAEYTNYVFLIDNLVTADNAVFMGVRTSTNNGSSYDAGASDYIYGGSYVSSAIDEGEATSTGGASIIVTVVVSSLTIGNAAGKSLSGIIHLLNPSNTANTQVIYSITYQGNSDTRTVHNIGAGIRASAADVDAVRFLMSTGNITSGTIYLYGIKNS